MNWYYWHRPAAADGGDVMAYLITENCIGCTICAKNCPAGAISGQVKEQHTIDSQYCIDCGLCGKLCPKGAILDFSGTVCSKIPKSQWKKPVIDKVACAGCSVCVENCPKDCLELEGPKFHGDIHTVAQLVFHKEDACIGCGICGSVCPIGAISF